MKILILAIEFPPYNLTGSNRYVKFIPELFKLGFDITVITPLESEMLILNPFVQKDNLLQNATYPYCEVLRIESGIKLPKNNLIRKIQSIYKIHQINLDVWYKNICSYISKNTSFDYLFVSIPQFELSELAIKIKNKFRLKLHVDIRDEWSINKSIPFNTYLQYKYVLSKENDIFKHSDSISIVTLELFRILTKKHPQAILNKIGVVTNGFDQNDLNFSFERTIEIKKKYTITYTGSFYYDPEFEKLTVPFYKRKGLKKISYRSSNEDWSYRSPKYFLKALKSLFDSNPAFRQNIQFHFVGTEPIWLRKMIKYYNLEDIYFSHGFVSKQENIEIIKNSDALLITSEKVINGKHYCISSKLFDYLATNKLIFGFVTEGEVKEIIDKTKSGVVFNPDEVNRNAMKMKIIFTEGYRTEVEVIELSNYLPKIITKKLAKLINP